MKSNNDDSELYARWYLHALLRGIIKIGSHSNLQASLNSIQSNEITSIAY